MKLRSSRRLRLLAAGSAGAMALALAPMATPAYAASAPSCVDFWTTGNILWKTFHVYNGCSTTQRLKIIINFHTDSGCNSLPSGWQLDYGVPGQATLENVVTC